MQTSKGFTFVEVIIAMAIIAIAFSTLLLSQVSSYKVTTQMRYASDTKAAATKVMEAILADVARTITSAQAGYDATYKDATVGGVDVSYYFVDYAFTCVSGTPTPPRTLRTNLAFDGTVTGGVCTGTTADLPASLAGAIGSFISINWTIASEPGLTGEGLLKVIVEAQHTRGARVFLVERVSCYDVYPSPNMSVPKPCPDPAGL